MRVFTAAATIAALLLLTAVPDPSDAKGGSRGGGSRGGSRGGSGSSGRRGGDSHRANTPKPYAPAPRPTPKPSAPELYPRQPAYNPDPYPKQQPAVNPGWNPAPPKPAQQPGLNPPPPQPGWNPPPSQNQPGWKPPGQAQPGAPQPGWAQPGQHQPGMPQPGYAQPGAPQPGWAQPGQPGWKQPGQYQPGAPHYQPGAPQPGWAQPGAPHYQPGAPQPGWAQPGQPGWRQPGQYQPGAPQPGWGQPGYQQPGGWGQPGHQQPGGWGQPGYQQQPGGWGQSSWSQPSYPGQQWHGSSNYPSFGGAPGMHSNNVGQHSSFMGGSYHPSYFGNSGYKSKNKFFPSFGGHGGGGGYYGGNYGRVGSFGSSKMRFLPLIPLLFVVPFLMPHFTPSMFRSCTCATVNRITVCPNKLSDGHVPSCVDDDTNAIFIFSRKVRYLSGDAFRHTRKLEYINVTNTEVEALPRDVFQYSPKVKTVVIQSNRDLSTLDADLFHGLEYLESLFLDHNQLKRLPPDLLRPLEALTTLNLGHNRLDELPKGLLDRNARLTEVALSGNGLQSLPEDLLVHCPRLRVLLLSDNKLRALPPGLFRESRALEWLDVGHNDLLQLPAALLKPCPRLGWLGVARNRLETLEAGLLLDHGGTLSALQLADNPWTCNCDLLPLAGWAVLRADALDGAAPQCAAPGEVAGWELRKWFHDRGALCETSPLQGRLQELLGLALALAWDDPGAGRNASVSFVAASHFRYALAAEASTVDPEVLVGRFVDLLRGVYGRKFPGGNNSTTGQQAIGGNANNNATNTNISNSDVSEVERIKMRLMKAATIEEIETIFNETLGNRTKYVTVEENGTAVNATTTTTTAPPSAVSANSTTFTSLQKLRQDIVNATTQNELYETLLKSLRERRNSSSFAKADNTSTLNFTFIFRDVPQNVSAEVDLGLVQELRLLFGANVTSNATTTANLPSPSVNQTANANSTINVTDTAGRANSSDANSNTTLLLSNSDANGSTEHHSSVSLNETDSVMMDTNNKTDSANATGSSTQTSGDLNVTNANGSNSSVADASKLSANNTTSLSPLSNSTNITVPEGLRSELRQVMTMLLTSVDRAKWDMENVNNTNTAVKKPRPSSHFHTRSLAAVGKISSPVVVCLSSLLAALAFRFL